jgi:hypothetical protein
MTESAAPAAKKADADSLEFQMDEEISISPTSGATPKTPADILAGAESELEKTAKHTGATMAAGVAATGAAIAGAVGAGKSAAEARAESLAEKVEAARE